MQRLNQPLAERLRPKTLKAVAGQDHLIGKDKPLTRLIKSERLPSLLLWGPPGTGKTTLARIIALELHRPFEQLSAVDATVKDVRAVVTQAESRQRLKESSPILFIDEIHRFNTAQQDALLHAVETGLVTLIGATTENPSFKVNTALLSRMRVFQLKPIDHKSLHRLVRKALHHYPRHKITKEAIEYLIASADGDARTLFNSFEVAVSLARKIDLDLMESAVQKKSVKYDRAGENHYDTISAFIKSIRGSDPNATLHYLARMLEAGEDPLFISRRMVILASEDIGNALPTALVIATAAMQAVKMIGLPEAELILAQAATYLASAPKSRAVTRGINRAKQDLKDKIIEPIPLHLRNAPTKFMKDEGYGKGYSWPKKDGETTTTLGFLPNNLIDAHYYNLPKKA
ncbi:replication-associated recombination protein A [Candidatus Berkelbacteria bacterium]|nr:replication-associated recombination protein A [Candidatus Berkelbacteria bacterium]